MAPRPPTVDEVRAEIEARRPYCAAIMAAFMRNDIPGCEAAQAVMRAAFPTKQEQQR